jgi:hypothetical protein
VTPSFIAKENRAIPRNLAETNADYNMKRLYVWYTGGSSVYRRSFSGTRGTTIKAATHSIRRGIAAAAVACQQQPVPRRRDGVRAEPVPTSAGAGSGGGVGHAVSCPGAARGGQAVTRTAGGESPFPSPSRLHFACCVSGVSPSSPPSPVVDRAAGNSRVYAVYLTHRGLINR